MSKIKQKLKINLATVSSDTIRQRIYLIRGLKIMLDRDLALFYQVKPIALRQQVKRNIDRFPKDFMFQLTAAEVNILVSQNVIPSKRNLGGYLPYAFTEQGVAMLSSVLKSKRAIQANIAIIRAFVRMRQIFTDHQELLIKINKLEEKYDKDIEYILQVIQKLIQTKGESIPLNRRIGFNTN